MDKFSVLMSLYIKEQAGYFDECMKSILAQTVVPSEIVVVKDGPIGEELEAVLERYVESYPNLIKVVDLPVNQGLGLALAAGIPECTYNLVARMDTDDIAVPERFERQLLEFAKDPDLDICGSHIKEFDGTVDNVIAVRKVPLQHDEIAKYQKQRSAVNHMTVMFKKDAVLRAGNYQSVPLMEDDFLWVRMLQTGAKFKNLDDYLVFARTGYAMIARRGGWAYLKKYIHGRKRIFEVGYISYWDYWKTVAIQAVVALVPQKVRLYIFTNLLRQRKE